MRTIAVFLILAASMVTDARLHAWTTTTIRGTPHPIERVVTEDCPNPLKCER